jgi:HD superfamily phosphohydrolase
MLGNHAPEGDHGAGNPQQDEDLAHRQRPFLARNDSLPFGAPPSVPLYEATAAFVSTQVAWGVGKPVLRCSGAPALRRSRFALGRRPGDTRAMSRRGHSVIRDPVHGDIYLTSEEMRLLDTREMQRLRGVRQLGTAYLVYPGAQHTRFEHSLGTLHLTSRLVDAVNLNRALAPGALIGIADDEARILRAAALVHDITHIPFGHNIEDQSGILERHDSPSRFSSLLSSGTEVGRVLDGMGIRREVLAVLLPENEADRVRVPHYWRELLSDTICADILDYLRRDAYYTGLNLLYDERVVNYFKIDRSSGHLFVDFAKRGMVREDILSEVLRVLDARYFFSERVYYHHAKITAGAMIALSVETAMLYGGMKAEDLFDQTDESLLLLLERHMPEDAELRERQRELLQRFRSRRLLKRACVFPLDVNRAVQDELLDRFFAPGRQGERVDFEASVAGALRQRNVDPPIIALYCPARHMQLKEAATHVRFPRSDDIRPLSMYGSQVPHLGELERAYRDLWKMYLLAGTDDHKTLSLIGEIVAELLPRARNVYEPLR